MQGSDINAKNGLVSLNAEGDISLLAAENHVEQNSSNSGDSGSFGIGYQAGTNGTGFGIMASFGMSQGRGDGEQTTWSNTHINAGSLQINSGGDTTLRGAVANAGQIEGNIKGNLTIESLQDTATYDEDDMNEGASVFVGYGVSGGSLSYGQTTISSNYASVVEQSGLRAGDDGFQITVGGHTDLIGGAITSTDAAVDNKKNSFETASLSMSDIQNVAEYKAEGMSVGVGMGNGRGLSATPGIGSDQGHDSSMTQSAISGFAGNQDARTGDAETGIANNFDLEQVKNEIQAQTQITGEFVQQSKQLLQSYTAAQRKALREQAKQAQTDEERQAIAQQLKEVDVQEHILNILIGAVSGFGSLAVTQETLSAAAEQMRAEMIADSKKFPGVVDKDGKVLSNISGVSDGVNGDGIKIGGTRVDLDLLCGTTNERCAVNADGSLDLKDGKIQFIAKDPTTGEPMSFQDFLDNTPDGKKMAAAGVTGGVQGMAGTFFGEPYEVGSWQDKLVEAFAGPHDYIGGSVTGFYDEQGNERRNMSETVKFIDGKWTIVAVGLSSPFVAAQQLPPDVFNAIALFIKAGL